MKDQGVQQSNSGVTQHAACRVEFGTIMLWYYVVDRTPLFTYGAKVRRTMLAVHTCLF